MIVQSVTSPGDAITISLPENAGTIEPANKDRGPGEPWFTTDAASKPRKSIGASSLFMWILFVVVMLTFFAGCAYVAMAIWWPQPTANQQSTFETMGTAWKMGLARSLDSSVERRFRKIK